MARTVNKLSDFKIKQLPAGLHPDGNSLYLKVNPSGSKSWIYRYKVNGQTKKMGLGGYPLVGIADARKDAQRLRLTIQSGGDPVEIEREEKAARQASQERSNTFKECAEAFIEGKRHEWSNQKHGWQWTQSLEKNVFPDLGDRPIAEITISEVLDCLQKIWFDKTETATRVRQRMEQIFDYAITLEIREAANPAQWKGRLDKLLPKPSKVKKVKHHPAMDYFDAPAYYRTLTKETVSTLCLRLMILTATRSNEVRGARFSEIEGNIWTIPPERMKARKQFRVPLSPEAMAVIDLLKKHRDGLPVQTDYLFPSVTKPEQPISDVGVRKVLHADHPELSMHGFRSTLRDWAAEQTNFTREIAEAALAHSLESKTEAAYQRGDLLEKRRLLMDAWAKYVVGINRKLRRAKASAIFSDGT